MDQAAQVDAEHRDQTGPPALGDAAGDDVEHSRPRDHEQEQAGTEKDEEGGGLRHERRLGRARPSPPGFRRLGAVKTILLMRHAKSDWDASYGSDHDRPLAARGHRERDCDGQGAVGVGRSPRPRAHLLGSARLDNGGGSGARRRMGLPSVVVPDFYGTGPDSVLRRAEKQAGDEERIMLVGHEPTWSMLAERISGGRLEMRTGAVVAIDLLADHWHGLDQARGWVRFAINPRMFFGSEWDQDEGA